MSFHRIFLTALGLALPFSAHAEGWTRTGTLYGWFPGLGAEIDTPRGTLEAERDFDELIENLDMAAFAALEARKGRWALIGDLSYTDLSTDITPDRARGATLGRIGATTTLLGAYATYAVVDQPGLRFELGGGLRYNVVTLEASLDGQGPLPPLAIEEDDRWADLLVAARVKADINDRWVAAAHLDLGGFGIGESSDLSWQVYSGAGYRMTDDWTVIGGYRHLEIDRPMGGLDTVQTISGPVLGLQARF